MGQAPSPDTPPPVEARYRALHVVTQDTDERWLSPGVVDVAGGRIVWVGAAEAAPELPAGVSTHDLDGMLLPGFVNAHGHVGDTRLYKLRGGVLHRLPVGQ